jgi:hypothetical protein
VVALKLLIRGRGDIVANVWVETVMTNVKEEAQAEAGSSTTPLADTANDKRLGEAPGKGQSGGGGTKKKKKGKR